MATKRKSDAGAKPQKRGRKKKDDYDSDLSDGADYVEDKSGKVEVLISGSDDLEPVAKLPEELLATYDKTPGKMLVAGLVTWDLTGRRDPKGKVTKIRPNLYTFHKFTDQMVSTEWRNCKNFTLLELWLYNYSTVSQSVGHLPLTAF